MIQDLSKVLVYHPIVKFSQKSTQITNQCGNVHDNGSYFYSQHIMIDVQDNGREWSKRVWNCSVTWAPGQIRQKCYQRYKFLSLLYDFDLFVIPSLSLLYVFRQQWMICILQWQHDGYMCTFLCNWFFCIMTSSIVK